MLRTTLSIKSRALAFCDCVKAQEKFKDCIRPSPFRQSMIPTMVENDRCVFCDCYVYWEPSYVPYCGCPEVLLLHKGEDLEYYKSRPTKLRYEYLGKRKNKRKSKKKAHKVTYRLKKESDLPPPWDRGKEPTETFKQKTNYCKFCGDIVQWRKQGE